MYDVILSFQDDMAENATKSMSLAGKVKALSRDLETGFM